MAQAEDSDSPVALKLKKMWLKTPVSEEQAAQAVLDPAIGEIFAISIFVFFSHRQDISLRLKEEGKK